MRQRMRCSVLAALALGAAGLGARPALAQSIIKNPGDHAKTVEIEPHLNLRPFGTYNGDVGWGLGLRVGIPIGDNLFISSINNGIAISFGFDWMTYHGCDGRYYSCGALNYFSLPVVLQWNFFLTRSWSVFAEPGLEIDFYGGDRCNGAGCPGYNTLNPVLFAGARWHFGASTALTMRIGLDRWDQFGAPYFSIGVSFL